MEGMYRVENETELYFLDMEVNLDSVIPLDTEIYGIKVKNMGFFAKCKIYVGNVNTGAEERFGVICYKTNIIKFDFVLTSNFNYSDDNYLTFTKKGIIDNLQKQLTQIPSTLISTKTKKEFQQFYSQKVENYNILFYKFKKCFIVHNLRRRFNKIVSLKEDKFCVLKRSEKINNETGSLFFYKGNLIYNIQKNLSLNRVNFVQLFKPMGLELIIRDYNIVKHYMHHLIPDEMLIKILVKFLSPKKIYEIFKRKQNWSPRDFVVYKTSLKNNYTKEYQHFVCFLLFLNSKTNSIFSKISSDVLMYKIIPFISEKEVVLTKYNKIIKYFLLLKGFAWSKSKIVSVFNEKGKCKSFKKTIERILSENVNELMISNDLLSYMIGLKIFDKIGRTIKIKCFYKCLYYLNLFFKLFIKNDSKNEKKVEIVERVDKRIVKNTIRLIVKFISLSRLSDKNVENLTGKLCMFNLRVKNKEYKYLILNYFSKIVVSRYVKTQKICNKIIENLPLFLSCNDDFEKIVSILSKIIKSNASLNEKFFIKCCKSIGKYWSEMEWEEEEEDDFFDGNYDFMIKFLQSAVKVIKLEEMFNKTDFYYDLIEVFKNHFFGIKEAFVDCDEIFNCVVIVYDVFNEFTKFGYSNSKDYLNLLYNLGKKTNQELNLEKEIDILKSVVFLINKKKMKNDCKLTEIDFNAVFKGLEKLDYNLFIFSDVRYHTFFYHCLSLIRKVFFKEEYEKFLKMNLEVKSDGKEVLIEKNPLKVIRDDDKTCSPILQIYVPKFIKQKDIIQKNENGFCFNPEFSEIKGCPFLFNNQVDKMKVYFKKPFKLNLDLVVPKEDKKENQNKSEYPDFNEKHPSTGNKEDYFEKPFETISKFMLNPKENKKSIMRDSENKMKSFSFEKEKPTFKFTCNRDDGPCSTGTKEDYFENPFDTISEFVLNPKENKKSISDSENKMSGFSFEKEGTAFEFT